MVSSKPENVRRSPHPELNRRPRSYQLFPRSNAHSRRQACCRPPLHHGKNVGLRERVVDQPNRSEAWAITEPTRVGPSIRPLVGPNPAHTAKAGEPEAAFARRQCVDGVPAGRPGWPSSRGSGPTRQTYMRGRRLGLQSWLRFDSPDPALPDLNMKDQDRVRNVPRPKPRQRSLSHTPGHAQCDFAGRKSS